MRRACLAAVLLAACGSDPSLAVDAGPDAPPDAPADAAPDAACDRLLLAGGTDIASQGWSVVAQGPNMLTNGADFVELATSTAAGVGGQLLLTAPASLQPPFRLQVELLLRAAAPHNQFDAGAAVLGAFTPPFGLPAERAQMIYLDPGAIGWADDTQTFAVALRDDAFHTLELAVDAAGTAQVRLDGAAALTRTGFTGGTLAIGDQSNDPNLDGTLRVRSVRLRCP